LRQIRYQVIADDLRRRLTEGEFAAGRVLPSEATLSADYEASRVTVRRALEALRAEGLVESRKGFGWLVAADPLPQELGRLGTIERQLEAAGIRSERRVLAFGFVPSPGRVKDLLGERTVLEVTRLHLADGGPFARVTVWCPESLGADLSRSDVERASFLEQLDVEVGGATQTIGADAAGADDAALLEVPLGSPVLVAERITRSTSGQPVLVSELVFPAHRTQFVVELPADDGRLPAGLRLVE
jgi:GntR family transcriptional regulator